jgi:hypothetical protein
LIKDTITENSAPETQLLHPGSRVLFRHWEAQRGSRACPRRSDFSLSDVRQTTSQLFVLEFQALRNTFVCRLFASGLEAYHGTDLTGMDVLTGWTGYDRHVQLRVLKAVMTQAQPALIRTRLTNSAGESIGVETIALPYAVNDTQFHLIGGQFAFALPQHSAAAITRRDLISARSISTEHVHGNAQPLHFTSGSLPSLRVIRGGKV